MKYAVLFTVFLFNSHSYGQFKKIKTIAVTETIIQASVDRAGDLYLTTVGGQFLKYDKNGILEVVYHNNPTPDLFDPRDGARLFAFYRDSRQYAYLTPSFDFLNAVRIDSAFVIDPWLICSSGDLNVWIIDRADRSLKKINTTQSRVDVDVKLDPALKIDDIIYLREYQGFVIALTKTGTLFFYNSMGKPIKTIAEQNLTYFNFLGEELYYLYQGNLKFFDLFTAETRTVKLPVPCTFALVTDERLYEVHEKTIDFFEYKP